MKYQFRHRKILLPIAFAIICACTTKKSDEFKYNPKEIIDLGTVVTEDLPEKIWGKALMNQLGFEKNNEFDIREWEFKTKDGKVTGSNAYYTLFNHGGPHIDAPNHIDVGGGLDSYSIDNFIGPLKVFDVSKFSNGRTITKEIFQDKVIPGDVVLIFTGYSPPKSKDELPTTITLTYKASEYLAKLPIRAFGTDALSVASLTDTTSVVAETDIIRAAPIHHSFLSRGIPVYEQLFNIEQLLDKSNMIFCGVPINIKNGDGILVRPVAIVLK
ncbi:cyclase family protein [Aestuariivivens sediminis]|uniref:cyclase family protein n=1 Tax=Aestuariivivens sediminis TaxID=2913557 RepID=UPI001F56D915|nr:cyclase family protein [Aestuariivivens sediminis]